LTSGYENRELPDPEMEFKTFRYRNLLQEETTSTKKSLLNSFFKIAAIVAISVGLSYLAFSLLEKRKSGPDSYYTEIETKAGEKSQITLPDGSKIWINACTKLRYPNNLNKSEIDLFLDGEAFFDLKRIPDRQITVRTSRINVKVLGTAFNLKSYKDDDVVETTLVRGKIEIENGTGRKKGSKTILLTPNQAATYFKSADSLSVDDFAEVRINTAENLDNLKKIAVSRNSNIVVMDKINPETQISWKEGKLSFRKETFENLAKMMERWYDINIEIKDPVLKKARFSGSFDKETIEQALQALSYPVPFRYIIEKDSVIIFPKVKP
jgi:ferric-dicitrate binding protein FerR (iron transport regulator)